MGERMIFDGVASVSATSIAASENGEAEEFNLLWLCYVCKL